MRSGLIFLSLFSFPHFPLNNTAVLTWHYWLLIARCQYISQGWTDAHTRLHKAWLTNVFIIDRVRAATLED